MGKRDCGGEFENWMQRCNSTWFFIRKRAIEDKVAGIEDKVPRTEDKAPEIEDKHPKIEDKLPRIEDKA